MNINHARNVVKDAINEQKEKLINELNEISSKVEKHTSFSEIIGELVEVYGNSNEQRKVMVDTMRTLPGNFFTHSDVHSKMNAVSLVFDGITFSISTSRLRSIDISIEKIIEPIEPTKEAYKTYTSYEVDFLEAWRDKSMDDLSAKEEKGLIKTYFNVRRGRDIPFLYTRKLRNSNFEEINIYLEDIEKRMNEYRKEIYEIKKENEQYEVRLNKHNELLNVLEANFKGFIEDNFHILEDFKNTSWKINFENIPDEWLKEVNF